MRVPVRHIGGQGDSELVICMACNDLMILVDLGRVNGAFKASASLFSLSAWSRTEVGDQLLHKLVLSCRGGLRALRASSAGLRFLRFFT